MNKDLGNFGEDYVSNYLENSGFKIIERNYRVRLIGEIDIIAVKDRKIHFIEVKTRKSLAFGTPEEAFSYKKQEKIIRTALNYLLEKNLKSPFQIDLAALIINSDNKVESIKLYENVIQFRD